MYHNNILDTDLYKLTQQLAICQLYPNVKARYTFINRDKRAFPEGFGRTLRMIVDSFAEFEVSNDQIDFLYEKCYYMNPVYFDFLKGYRYDPSEVHIEQTGENLEVWVEGPWYSTVLWEVPLMATISELYFEMTTHTVSIEERQFNNQVKARALKDLDIYFSEFGTRRRYSYENQGNVIGTLKLCGEHFLGTSNVHFAMQLDSAPMGTVAHEWFQAHAAMFGFLRGNTEAMEAWVKVYGGDLGIALPDTFTTDVFYKYAFNTKYAKLFDGVRQDSGDPTAFVDKTVAHYNKLRIQPRLKTILFSDNLKSVEQIKGIHNYCMEQNVKDRISDRYGIGTWLSNDVGVKPLNIVIKLTAIDFGHGWVNTVKLSDVDSKHTGNSETVELCKRTLNLSS